MYWDLLKEFICQFEPEALRELRAPATTEQINHLEARLGFALPDSLVCAWREHDGTRASYDTPSPLPELLSIDAMAGAREQIVDHWWSGMGDAGFLVPIQEPLLQYLCVDAFGGAVIEVDWEGGSSEVVAPSLSAWFRKYAENLAAENGFRFVDGRAVCTEAELLQIRRWDEGGGEAGREVIQFPSLASLDERDEGKTSAWLVQGLTQGLEGRIVGGPVEERVLAVGDIVRCEVAQVPRIVTRVALVESAGVRLRRVESALAPWRESGFELPPVGPEDLLALRWNADAAAAGFVARHGPVLKEPWGPPILSDTLEKISAKLAAWHVPPVELDRDAILDAALRAARAAAMSGTLFIHIQMSVFARINSELARTRDARSFLHLKGAPPPLDDAWILVDPFQAQVLRARLAFLLESAEEPTPGVRFRPRGD